MVRVIAGTAKGRKLKTIDKDTTKPTLDRVKEPVFSMLMNCLEGARVLDLFAGNGALGIEALSRGAEFCIFNDFSAECAKIVKENAESCGFDGKFRVECRDAVEVINKLAAEKEKINLLFLDPPYESGLYEKALLTFSEKMLPISGVAIAVCEHAAENVLPENIGKFAKVKERKYGTVGISIYRAEAD